MWKRQNINEKRWRELTDTSTWFNGVFHSIKLVKGGTLGQLVATQQQINYLADFSSKLTEKMSCFGHM